MNRHIKINSLQLRIFKESITLKFLIGIAEEGLLEAKICPDGRAIGRSGPNCEFPACPDIVTAPNEEVSKDVVFKVGDRVDIANLTVTLNKVLQDSRCPIDVVCIQAGSVTVEVVLTNSTRRETITLSTDATPHLFDGYYISILSVTPSPMSKKEIKPSDYRVTLHVVK